MPAMQQPEAYIGGADKLFDASGRLVNDRTRKFLKDFIPSFLNLDLRRNATGADGPRVQRVFEGRAKVSGQTVEQIKTKAMSGAIAQTTGRSQGHCCFGFVPCFECREVDIGSDDADRQRCAAGQLILSLDRRSPPMR